MHAIDYYREAFTVYLQDKMQPKAPQNLYEPMRYILNLGGKRIRPVLTLLATEIFGSDYKIALNAALAIEVFHNFSLVHDDIMDDAPLRRGATTVHEKWDVNTGILSGDAMLITAYQLFEHYRAHQFKSLAQLFSRTALQVCEGQQYDIDFENRDDVTLPEYIQMITYKTAVLVAAALKMGGIIAEASAEDQSKIYDFGLNLGIAFQLQDDYLDAFGNPDTFGKQVGGDIIENKKTVLYLNALTHGTSSDKKELLDLYSIKPNDSAPKVKSITRIFLESGAAEFTKKEIAAYTHKAFLSLDQLDIEPSKKMILTNFGKQLMGREV